MQILELHRSSPFSDCLDKKALFERKIAEPYEFVLQGHFTQMNINDLFLSEDRAHRVPIKLRLFCYFTIIVPIGFENLWVFEGYNELTAHKFTYLFMAFARTIVDIITRNELDRKRLSWVWLIRPSNFYVIVKTIQGICVVLQISFTYASNWIKSALT